MSRERWTQLTDTLVELKLIDRAKVNVDASFRADFLEPSGKGQRPQKSGRYSRHGAFHDAERRDTLSPWDDDLMVARLMESHALC